MKNCETMIKQREVEISGGLGNHSKTNKVILFKSNRKFGNNHTHRDSHMSTNERTSEQEHRYYFQEVLCLIIKNLNIQ